LRELTYTSKICKRICPRFNLAGILAINQEVIFFLVEAGLLRMKMRTLFPTMVLITTVEALKALKSKTEKRLS
jgi:hypothetical protein